MSPEPDFQQIQQAFTTWLRHPTQAPVPVGIEQRRLDTYRELLFNNVASFVDMTFPVAQALLPTALWVRLKTQFFADFSCRSPFFYDISLHFREYVDALDWPELANVPWLRELLHYEWMELVADIDDSPVLADHELASTDLLDAANPTLALATPAWPLAYQWRVHEWHADTRATDQTPSPCCLLAFRGRDASLSLRVLEVTPLAAFLIEALQATDDMPTTLHDLVTRLCDASPGLAAAQAQDMVRSILRDLAGHGVCFRR